jgi:hypothetical protein
LVFNSLNGNLQISRGTQKALKVTNTDGLLDFYFYGTIHANEEPPDSDVQESELIPDGPQIGDWNFTTTTAKDLLVSYHDKSALCITKGSAGLLDFYFYGTVHTDVTE